MIYFSTATNKFYTSKLYLSGEEKNRPILVKQKYVLGLLLVTMCVSLLWFIVHYWKNNIITPVSAPLLVFPVLFIAFSFSGKVDNSVTRSKLKKHKLSYVAYLFVLLIAFTAIMLSVALVKASLTLF